MAVLVSYLPKLMRAESDSSDRHDAP
jgi:hypothetical protein